MAVEVTSPSNATYDRAPVPGAKHGTTWRGYARVQIPYFLLVDRAPKISRTTLFSIPDPATGAYLHQESWALGEEIQLPEPFETTIPTTEWYPWGE